MRGSFRQTVNAMNLTKISMSTSIVFALCLILLLMPAAYQFDIETQSHSLDKTAFKATKHTQNRTGAGVVEAPIESQRTARIQANPVAVNSARVLLDLYPALEEIIQLENLPAEMAIGQLQLLLFDADPVIRLAALEAVADTSHQARLAVLNAALDDPVAQIRIAAVEALGAAMSPLAVNSIEPYLFDREREVRIAAIEALARLQQEQAVHLLAGLLSEQDIVVRRHAVNAMGEIGGENAISYLLQAHYDPDQTIRANAQAIVEELASISIY